ncbi:hypothetical protein Pint_29357 [Pistacia integerrima]|uniref:Uncharacterized protein n=1 Tax=Pistacia integerrima TaxID=434235 RepID=A0ACC0WZV2_9ROSI|nr:hypothetical protein Pint_29357 [Pistacia integerrima]
MVCFKEAMTACCGSGPYRGISSCGGKRAGIEEHELCDNPAEYFYFDSGHATERAYKLFAELILIIPGHAHQPSPKTQVALFIFRDSLFDAGNNIYINTTVCYRANFWPYSETFFKYPTGRASNGRLFLDFIVTINSNIFSILQLSILFGVNFASGGAGALAETHPGYVIDLNTQLSYFKLVEKEFKQKLGDAGAKTLLSKAVYLFISIGTNDYFVPLRTNSSVLQSDYSRKQYIGMVIGNLTTEIYKIRGRKFGFTSLRPRTFPSLESNCAWNLRILPGECFRGFKDAIMACCGSGRYKGILSCGGMIEIKEY